MPLGLSPRESTIFEDQLQQMPTAVIPQATGAEVVGENIRAPGGAILTGGAQTYEALRALGSNFGAMGGYDPETGSVVEETPEAVQRKFALDSTAVANQFKPDPRRSGAGAQFINSIGSGAVRMIGGTLVTGSPLGGAAVMAATEGVDTRNDIYAATGDKETADKLAIGSALFSGVAALLPGGYGNTFAQRIATGAVANTTFGVLQRDMMHTMLQDAGYADMAKQYVPLDGAAMMADGILGTVFGAAHHMFSPDITDSARAVKDAVHAERSSPGVPIDPVSRQAGLDALDKHVDALIRGDETPPATDDVRYAPDTAQDAVREAAMQEVTVLREEAIGKQEEVPIEAFHGTTVAFGDQYQMGREDVGLGPHFGTVEQANQVAQGEGGNVRPVSLGLKNPLRMTDGGWEVPDSVIKQLRKLNVISDKEMAELLGHESDKAKFDAIRQKLLDKGYDSIVYENLGEGVRKLPNGQLSRDDSYIALKPNEQVKARLGGVEPPPKEGENPVVLDPETQDALLAARDAIHAYPDLEVAGDNPGESVSAVAALRQAMDDLKNAGEDDELHRVALACAGRA